MSSEHTQDGTCEVSKQVSLGIYIRRQNHEDVSMVPGGREQVHLHSSVPA